MILTYVEMITDELGRLSNKLTPVLSGELWSGQAQHYYQGLQTEWQIAASGLFGSEGVLAQIALVLGIVWQNYADAEWANTITWRHR